MPPITPLFQLRRSP